MDDFDLAESKNHLSRRRRPKKVIAEKEIAHQRARFRRKWAGWRVPFLRSPFFHVHPIMPVLSSLLIFLGYAFVLDEIFHRELSTFEQRMLPFLFPLALIYAGSLMIVRKMAWRDWDTVPGSSTTFEGKILFALGFILLIIYSIALLVS